MIEASQEQKILLDNLKRVVKDKIAPLASEIDKTGQFNWDVVSLFWDLGLLQILLPEEYGGWPQNPTHTLCLSIEEIAKACASSALLLIIQAVGTYPLIYSGNADVILAYCDREAFRHLRVAPVSLREKDSLCASSLQCGVWQHDLVERDCHGSGQKLGQILSHPPAQR